LGITASVKVLVDGGKVVAQLSDGSLVFALG
jgi:hypothetical protein